MTGQPLELMPVDISPWADGNTGTRFVHAIDSGQPGPNVLLTALTHGNELCGAHALVHLLQEGIALRRGRLTLAFANADAYHRFDAARPTESRFIDEDLNRVWSKEILDGPRSSREVARARELRPFVEAADYLLDIHSMQTPAPALTLCGLQRKGRELAFRLGMPEFVVADAGHRSGPRMRDFGGFADAGDPRTALLVECGQHWQARSRDVAIHAALRFLAALDCVEPGWIGPRMAFPPEPQRFVLVTEAVTVGSPRFRFRREFKGMEVIPQAGTVIADDGDHTVATPYPDCVLIMPTQRVVVGQTAVRFGRFEA